jgi:hypothetical protein
MKIWHHLILIIDNNRYVYIHVSRATAEGVYVQQSYVTLV